MLLAQNNVRLNSTRFDFLRPSVGPVVRMASGHSSQQQRHCKGKQSASPQTEVQLATRPATESRFSGFARMLQFTPAAPSLSRQTSASDVMNLLNTIEAENARLRGLTAVLPRQMLAELAAQGAEDEARRRAAARTQTFARALVVVALMLLSFAAGLRLGAGAAGAPAKHQRGMSWRPATSSPREYKGRPDGVGLLHVTAVETSPGYVGRFGLPYLGPRRPRADTELQMRPLGSLRH